MTKIKIVWCKDCQQFAWCHDPVYHGACGAFTPISTEDPFDINNSRKAVTTMGYTKKQTTAKTEAEVKDQVKIEELEVLRAGVINDTTVGFDLKVRGITIKGFYVRICKAGTPDEFKIVSKPSKKGSDGKYYDQVFIPGFTKEVQSAIIDKVESLIE